jgi:hypothetical protein
MTTAENLQLPNRFLFSLLFAPRRRRTPPAQAVSISSNTVFLNAYLGPNLGTLVVPALACANARTAPFA